MSAEWRLGKVEMVTVGEDGKVREVKVAYRNIDGKIKEKGDIAWRHMTVVRPVRNIVKLFEICGTTLMSEMEYVRKACEEVFKEEEKGGSIHALRMVEEKAKDELTDEWRTEIDFMNAQHFLYVISQNDSEEKIFLL